MKAQKNNIISAVAPEFQNTARKLNRHNTQVVHYAEASLSTRATARVAAVFRNNLAIKLRCTFCVYSVSSPRTRNSTANSASSAVLFQVYNSNCLFSAWTGALGGNGARYRASPASKAVIVTPLLVPRSTTLRPPLPRRHRR